MERENFDLKALYAALDQHRQARGLTWAQATRDISAGGPVPARRPVASSTITGLRTKALADVYQKASSSRSRTVRTRHFAIRRIRFSGRGWL